MNYQKYLSAALITGVVFTGGCDMEMDRAESFEFQETALMATTVLRTEAEAMTLSGFSNVANAAMSGGKYITTTGTGTATTTFNGPAGSYDVVVCFYDHFDGIASYSLVVDNVVKASWSASPVNGADPTRNTHSIPNIKFAASSKLQVTGKANGGRIAAIDMIEIAPAVQVIPTFTRNRTLAANDFSAIAYSGSKFVAVGGDSTIQTSSDGITWTNVTTGPVGHIRGIVYNTDKRLFYINAMDPDLNQGKIFSSIDGAAWTLVKSNTPGGRLLFTNNVYFIADNYVAPYMSTDLLTWTAGTNPVDGSDDTYYSMAYGNGLYVGVGDYDGNTVIGYSKDGLRWTRGTFNLRGLTLVSVLYSNNRFIAVGQAGDAYYSPDGKVWTYSPVATGGVDLSVVLYNAAASPAGFQVIAKHGLTYTSPDGKSWKSLGTLKLTGALTAATYSNVRYVAVGEDGIKVRSSNLASWAVISPANPMAIQGLAFGNGAFVAGGRSLRWSTNGTTWTISKTFTDREVVKVRFYNGAFYALVNFDGPIDGVLSTILKSTDGKSWTTVFSGSESLFDLAYGNGVWVTVDFVGRIFRSINSTTWAQTGLSPSILTGVVYGQSKFLAMGADGSYLLSSDGKTWTTKQSVDLIPQVMGGVAFGGGVFAAMAENSARVYTSYDGLIWNRRALLPGEAWDGRVDAVNGRLFVTARANGTLLTSENGVTWARCKSDTLGDLFSVAYGNAIYLAGGDNMTVLTGR